MDESPSETMRSQTISPKGGSAESDPREAKLFPVPIPIMAPIIQWTVFSLPIDESHPLLGHHQVDLQKEIVGADLLENLRLFSG
jgi:hypothetical protein